jgi:hypothetical protein
MYLETLKLRPLLLIEGLVEALNIFGTQKVYEGISDIAIILHIKEYYVVVKGQIQEVVAVWMLLIHFFGK